MSTFTETDVILLRAQTGREAMEAALQPFGRAIFIACFTLILILGAISVEAFTLSVAFKTQYQALSTGYDLGASLLPLRYGVIAALIFSHVLLHGNPGRDGSAHGFLGKLGVLPVIAVIVGLAVFMFTATATATGGEDGKPGITGWALGAVCACLFSISFLSCNRLISILLPALHTIFSGAAQRMKIAYVDRLLKTVDESSASLKTLRREIAEREAPGVLQRRAATEAASIVGKVASEAHDFHASAEAIKDVELRPDDTSPLSDTPVAALDKRQAYLKSLTVDYFVAVLANGEA